MLISARNFADDVVDGTVSVQPCVLLFRSSASFAPTVRHLHCQFHLNETNTYVVHGHEKQGALGVPSKRRRPRIDYLGAVQLLDNYKPGMVSVLRSTTGVTFVLRASDFYLIFLPIMPSAKPPTDLPASSPPAGFSKPFSISLSNSKSKASLSATPKPPNPKKRPHSSLADSDSDNDGINRGPQLVSAFDHSAGGAIGINGVEQPKAPLVIHGPKNRDWRDEARRKKGKNILPPEVQAAGSGAASNGGGTERDEVSKEGGLTFLKREVRDGEVDTEMEEDHAIVNAQTEFKPRDADDEALAALLDDRDKKSTLVLPATNANGRADSLRDGRDTFPANEDDMFRNDVASRPDMASLDAYAAVPVEEFGAALLRGMGWKEGDAVGRRKEQISKPKVIERRPALLGIGAKEAPGGVGDELGAWGKGAKGKKKVDKTYNPVMLRNSVTGEMLTEEELAEKKEKQKKEELDWRERRDRNLAIDEGKKREMLAIADTRSRDQDRSNGSSRHTSSRRDRSRSLGSSRHSSSNRERSRSPKGSRHSSSRRDRSRSRERHRGKWRDYNNDDEYDRKERDRRRRERYDGKEASSSSRHRHRATDDYDDSQRRRREEVC